MNYRIFPTVICSSERTVTVWDHPRQSRVVPCAADFACFHPPLGQKGMGLGARGTSYALWAVRRKASESLPREAADRISIHIELPMVFPEMSSATC